MPSPWLILAAVLALLACAVGGWYARGQWDEGKAAQVVVVQQKQEQEATKEQHHEILAAEIRYVDRVRVVHDRIAAFNLEFMSRCLRDGAAGVSPMPGSSAALGADGAGADAAARRWCERVAANYAAGQGNTEKLELCREGVVAAGGAKP